MFYFCNHHTNLYHYFYDAIQIAQSKGQPLRIGPFNNYLSPTQKFVSVKLWVNRVLLLCNFNIIDIEAFILVVVSRIDSEMV